MTALHYAAYCNDPAAVLELLDAGMAVDARDDGGWTPLHWSIDMSQACGYPERVVSILLEHGASASSADESGYTVLMMACARNNENIMGQLIAAGANIHARSAESSPLHEAAGCNFHEAIITLLRAGADPKQINQNGRTAKDVAKKCGFIESFLAFRAHRRGT